MHFLITTICLIVACFGFMLLIHTLVTSGLGLDWTKLACGLILLFGFGFIWCNRVSEVTPEEQKAIDARLAQEAKLRVPVMISQTADGCRVYAFIDNGYRHYFTRCADGVTTDATRVVTSGKTSHTEIESIKTNH